VVHTQLLASQSEYLDGALNGGFREAQENSIYWEEDDQDALVLMVGFLYRGVIPSFDRQGSAGILNLRPLSQKSVLIPRSPLILPRPDSTQGMPDCFQHSHASLSPEEVRLDDY